MFDDELEAFKKQISLVDYAGTRGYQVDRRASSRSSVTMRHPGTEDKIVITRADDGHWTYFSVRDALDNGTIIDFVQRRQKVSIGQIRKELRPWIAGSRPTLAPSDYHPSIEAQRRDRLSVAASYEAAAAASDSAYLNSRGIRPETLQSLRFKYSFRVDQRGNVLFPHHDAEGLSGFEVKNRGWTGFSPGGTKALWASTVFDNDTVLVIAESAIDALSFHQLFPTPTARYVSTGGQMSDHQRACLADVIAALPRGAKTLLATDRDVAGDKLALDIEALSPGVVFERRLPPAMPNGKDWNDHLKVVEKDYIRKLRFRSGPEL